VTRAKVADASALAAILFNEPASQEIERALLDATLLAPSILLFELGNVCRTKCRQMPEERAALEAGLALFTELGVTEMPIDPAAVLALALDVQLSFYDASYLWLARSQGAALVTLDKKLAKAAAPKP
jgi:predicted nucleic acid-binding protein